MLSKAQVEHVALLGRLELSEEEKEKYASQLNDILEHVEKLSELDTRDIPPTAHVLPLRNVMREDRVCDSVTNEEALLNAPAKEEGYFKVPKII